MNPYTLADAEADALVALDTGDPARIAVAMATLERLDVPTPKATLHAAALWYVSVGLHVFPLSPRSKIPMPRSAGFKDATTDPEQINAWWTAQPEANIGIATGHLVDVIDIDGPQGQSSRAKHWESHFSKIDADAVAKVLTPRQGGMHIFVPSTGDGNSAGIFPGVDYRGLGGYVVAAPSENEVGKYRFLGTPSFDQLRVGVS